MAAKKSALVAAEMQLSVIPAKDVKQMDQSFLATLTDANNLERLMKKYGPQLKAVRVDADAVKSFSLRRDAFVEAQNAMAERSGTKRTPAELKLIAEGETLRKRMLEDLAYGARDHSLDAQLSAIRGGDGVDDLAKDLADLAALFSANLKKLVVKNAAAIAKNAKALSVRLSDVTAERRTEDTGAATDLRNRAFTWLDQAMREVRVAGRYALRDTPSAAALFAPRTHPGAHTKTAPAPQP